jgi:hypothetical protein
VVERSDIEEVDALPVLVPESQALAPRQAGRTIQVATVATGGFVMGAVVAGVLGRRRRKAVATRSLSRRERVTRDLVEIVASRSLLVDVHLLGTPARNR